MQGVLERGSISMQASDQCAGRSMPGSTFLRERLLPRPLSETFWSVFPARARQIKKGAPLRDNGCPMRAGRSCVSCATPRGNSGPVTPPANSFVFYCSTPLTSVGAGAIMLSLS